MSRIAKVDGAARVRAVAESATARVLEEVEVYHYY
jgi:hypothetical protein